MKSNKKVVKRKKPYEKPRLRVIEMASDEVLGVGCKLSSGGLAEGVSPCTAGFCAEEGS